MSIVIILIAILLIIIGTYQLIAGNCSAKLIGLFNILLNSFSLYQIKKHKEIFF